MYQSAMVMEDVPRTILFDTQRQAVRNRCKRTTGSGSLRMSSNWKTYTVYTSDIVLSLVSRPLLPQLRMDYITAKHTYVYMFY